MSEIIPTPIEDTDLALVECSDPARSPAAVYLASLPSPRQSSLVR
jgi:hypothetical protein